MARKRASDHYPTYNKKKATFSSYSTQRNVSTTTPTVLGSKSTTNTALPATFTQQLKHCLQVHTTSTLPTQTQHTHSQAQQDVQPTVTQPAQIQLNTPCLCKGKLVSGYAFVIMHCFYCWYRELQAFLKYRKSKFVYKYDEKEGEILVGRLKDGVLKCFGDWECIPKSDRAQYCGNCLQLYKLVDCRLQRAKVNKTYNPRLSNLDEVC